MFRRYITILINIFVENGDKRTFPEKFAMKKKTRKFKKKNNNSENLINSKKMPVGDINIGPKESSGAMDNSHGFTQEQWPKCQTYAKERSKNRTTHERFKVLNRGNDDVSMSPRIAGNRFYGK